MTATLNTRYNFYPVGQGLFAAGQIYQSRYRPRFTWVYDCGTSSEQKYLNQSLESLHRDTALSKYDPKPRIQLVAVSHFDKDHISGLESLLERFSIDALLLPYLPLWRRLELAFAEGIQPEDAIMQFFVNPAAYVASRAGAAVNRIYFVPKSDNRDPYEDNDRDADVGEQNSLDLSPIQVRAPHGEEENADFLEFEKRAGRGASFASMVNTKFPIRVDRRWEFIPYNDADVLPAPDRVFRNAVVNSRTALLGADSHVARQSALAVLKQLYIQRFGNENRNRISLFLYTGPMGMLRGNHVYIRFPRWTPANGSSLIPFWWGRPPVHSYRGSMLYTGDGYLDTQDRFDRLRQYLGARRLDRLTCVQVMHHGSSENWHEGVAEKLAPDISVFCADPERKRPGHPDAAVVRDFLRYGPVLVDQHQGVIVSMQVS